MKKESIPLVATLVNGLRILETLAHAGSEGLGVTEVATRLREHKSTVLRLLVTLENEGYVGQDARTLNYYLRTKLFQLGSAGLAGMDLVKVARPHLDRLGALTGEVVHLGVLDEGEVVYIIKVDSQHVINMYSRIGRRSPAHCTGLGKALIAYLPDDQLEQLIRLRGLKQYTPNTISDPAALRAHLAVIRERGVAFDHEEHEPGVRCVSAPVRDHSGAVVAAVSVAAPTLRLTPEQAEALVDTVRATANVISDELGYCPKPMDC
ncbi:MAG TPA: IclR family transcriptional regulator [Symbiobacteriaceae bacterium]|nr:IclR family transcriptional regulator [Symbiobacteriaceae bacterium]